MTPKKRAEYLRLVSQYAEAKAREGAHMPRGLRSFIGATSPKHLPVPGHLLPVVALFERASREPVRALLSMPPRHGKTVTAISALAWLVEQHPERLNAYVTYSEQRAYTQSRRARRLVQEARVPLSGDAQAVHEWRTPQGGGLIATGVGGGLTGLGINDGLLLVDDALKNREQAESVVVRDAVYEWFTDVAFTRLEGNASCIVIATRWHGDDLIGRLEAQRDPRWEVINLPAVDEHEHALWPERFPLPALQAIRSQIGEYAWASLYMGSPSPREGALFKTEWLQQRWVELPPGGTYAQSWDLSFKETDSGSYVVGQVWYQHGPNFYLVDQIRERMDFDATTRAIKALSARYPKAYTKLVEAKANGPAVASTLKRELSGIVLVEPEGGKISRANAVEGLFAAGNVLLPHQERAEYPDGRRGAPWLPAYIQELTTFPQAATDDQVDSTTQALNYFAPRLAQKMEQALESLGWT